MNVYDKALAHIEKNPDFFQKHKKEYCKSEYRRWLNKLLDKGVTEYYDSISKAVAINLILLNVSKEEFLSMTLEEGITYVYLFGE